MNTGTFISVGNSHQKFDRLFSALRTILSFLPQPVVVQCGHNNFLSTEATVIPFLEMDRFTSLLENSSLIIIHGGAGSIIQALHANKIPLVMPRRKSLNEHIDDHQYELCQELAQLNRIIQINSAREVMQNISRAIEFQTTRSSTSYNLNSLAADISNTLQTLSNHSKID